jgi:hypothetical protein
MMQVSNDHSYVQTLVDSGKISDEQAFYHPEKNIITQSLGDESHPPKPDFSFLPVLKGDKILMCSDGLNSMIQDSHIETIVKEEPDLNKCCKKLVDAANKEGGYDNITTILCEVIDSPTVLAEGSLPEIKSTIHTSSAGSKKKWWILVIVVLLCIAGAIIIISTQTTKEKKLETATIINDSANIDSSQQTVPDQTDETSVQDPGPAKENPSTSSNPELDQSLKMKKSYDILLAKLNTTLDSLLFHLEKGGLVDVNMGNTVKDLKRMSGSTKLLVSNAVREAKISKVAELGGNLDNIINLAPKSIPLIQKDLQEITAIRKELKDTYLLLVGK